MHKEVLKQLLPKFLQLYTYSLIAFKQKKWDTVTKVGDIKEWTSTRKLHRFQNQDSIRHEPQEK